MKHVDLRSQSSGEPPLPLLSRLPGQLPTSSVHAQGGLLVEDDVKGHLSNRASEIIKESDALKCDKPRAHQNSSNTTPGSTATGLLSQTSEVKNEEVVQVFLTLFWNHTLDLTFFVVKLKKKKISYLRKFANLQAYIGHDLQNQNLTLVSQPSGR